MEEAPLGGLSPKAFLRRHWQKRPLLVRGALPDIGDALSTKTLFALAARDEVESRLVQRRGRRWSVAHGPLHRKNLAQAGARNWTLLVNNVNCYSAAAERLLRRFSFIPQARLDDVMVSYAAPGGGVGPHFDSYDVFLLQLRGRRRWRLARARRFKLVRGAPLKLIAGFRPEEDMVLEPGDLLYLPPGWGHDGVALDPCLTASVGFRAPRAAELAAGFLDHLHERGLPDAGYRDPGLLPAARPGQIPAAMVGFAQAQLRRIRWARRDVVDFLGRYLSTPKPNVVFHPRKSSGPLAVLDASTQFLYAGKRFFINGESISPNARQRRVLAALADRRYAPARALTQAGLGRTLREWRRAGYLRLEKKT